MKRILIVLAFCLLTGLVFAGGTGEAVASDTEAWTPGGGNVTLITPYAAGGTSDQVARLFANSDAFYDANIVVENVPGGSCAIGLTKIVQSKPDGFTIGNTSTPMIVLPGSGRAGSCWAWQTACTPRVTGCWQTAKRRRQPTSSWNSFPRCTCSSSITAARSGRRSLQVTRQTAARSSTSGGSTTTTRRR